MTARQIIDKRLGMLQSSKHTLDAEVEFTLRDGERHKLYIQEIPCVWQWDVLSREAAELWAVIEYVAENFTDYLDFSVVSVSSTKGE
tara:strand:- start:559 stop:819 length:261 start_codon:yes stop_codon:yes gene_type:complete